MAGPVWRTELTEADLAELRELLLAVRQRDGRPEVAAQGPLPREFRGGEHLLDRADGRLIGYAHLDTSGDAFGRQVAELYVRPANRRRGVGARLAAALLDHAPDDVRVWAHGDHPAAAALAGRLGLRRARELHRMLLDPLPADLPAPKTPDGVTLRAFVPGRDEPAVVAVNGRAFDWHPVQGALSVGELLATEAEPWFDPNGFLLAVDAADRVLGFHWTKIHPGAGPNETPRDPVGEVYVLGVDPHAQGGGLGRALTIAGLRYLAERGLRRVILYVEGDNRPAIAVYSKIGFNLWDMDVQYAR